jgi:DNA helicase-2/ATP-dependent DNA helicase PcrA
VDAVAALNAEGLNAEQRRAVEAVRGPVCILAGAGSGKTTTITRRIAHQVVSGAFESSQILAVTFTDKAAGEMRARLDALGAGGVRARTFHSAALGLLRRYSPSPPGKIVGSKALLLRRIANGLPAPYKFRPAGDLATEIEWAKNRRLTPSTYLSCVDAHDPPIPADLMQRVFRDYELRKEGVDFEDLLELAIGVLEADAAALEDVRSRYLAFTVDEYQDVNLLQQTLLDLWLGERDELCAVGDDYQSIYGFTGATPQHLLALPTRFPHAVVVRLEENYRSTPQVLALANLLVPHLGGAEKTLRAAHADGPEPLVQQVADDAAFVAERVRALGIPYEDIAVLVRTNARTTEFEEAFHDAGIPFQGASLLARDAARQLLKRAQPGAPAAEEVPRVAAEQGWTQEIPDKVGERELVRQKDLARLVQLAVRHDGSVADWREYLHEHFGPSAGRGVHLLTLHRAKGLEWDAVFLPHVEEKELPIKLARTDAELADERRLLYVGLTRAKRHLFVTWSEKPSRFLREMGIVSAAAATAPGNGERRAKVAPEDRPPLFEPLRAWRKERAAADGVPPYVVFHDSTLAEIAQRAPRTREELASVGGVGPTKLDRYAEDVLRVLAAA